MRRQIFPSDRPLRAVVVVLAALSLACASAGRYGEDIRIADESAFIIWDGASKTQHFIRRASFETKAKDFGFLVPTPTKPKLGKRTTRCSGSSGISRRRCHRRHRTFLRA